MPAPAPAIAARQAAATAMTSASVDPATNANKTPAEFVPIVVIGLLIIATIAGLFGYRAWKGRRMAAESGASRQERKLDDWYNGSEDNDSTIEKPAKAQLAGDVEAYAGWVPQVHTWKGIHVQGMQLPSESAVGKARANEKKLKELEMSREITQPQVSPPPSYPADEKVRPPVLVMSALAPVDGDDKPIDSPLRTVSMFAPQEQQYIQPTTEESLPLPRVMIVQNTFTPHMDDELSVVRGEAIRMLAEYKDGWCVVQRVGAYDSPKGVVPRSCLQERQVASGRRV